MSIDMFPEGALEYLVHMDKAETVLGEVLEEVARQYHKWGEQNRPDGTTNTPTSREMADVAKRRNDVAEREGNLSWLGILREEYLEAACETDPELLRAELIQVAAVAVSWIGDIDRRKNS